MKWYLKHTIADKKIVEADLNASGLPVVIVRPCRLMDLPGRGLQNVATTEKGDVPFN